MTGAAAGARRRLAWVDRGRRTAIAVLAVASCAKPTALGADSGVAEAVAALTTAVVSLHDPPSGGTASADGTHLPPEGPPAAANEATRFGELQIDGVTRLREAPELSRHADIIRAHFAASSTTVTLQRAALGAGAHAILVAREADDTALILVTGASGDLRWTKDHPLAGVVPGARHLTLAAGASGQVALLFHASPWVAMRSWLADGSILADHQLLDMPACSGLAALHWPGAGMITVASSRAGPRAQLLSPRGTLSWGHDGIGVGAGWRVPPSPSLAIQAGGWLLSQQGSSVAGDDRWLVFRYDARGIAAWPAPLDLGPGATPQQRLELRAAGDGRVVAGPLSGRATPARRVWITAAGGVQPR